MLKERRQMEHISTGELFRNATRKQTPLGLEARKFLDLGKLVPDSVTVGLVEDVLSGLKGKSWILDGFPRTAGQADALETILGRLGLKLDCAVFVDVPKDFLMDRLCGRRVCKACGATFHVSANPPREDGKCDSCGDALIQRSDDRPDVIGTRIQAYEESTKPLREFYRSRGKYVEIDGVGTVEEIFTRLNEVL